MLRSMIRHAHELEAANLPSIHPELSEYDSVRARPRDWWAVAEPDLIRLFVVPLEELGIPCLVTGGVAAVIYGEPRFTRDVDIVLDLSAADAPRLARAFSGGDRHLRDVAAMLEVSGEAVDRTELDPWLARLDLGPALDQATTWSYAVHLERAQPTRGPGERVPPEGNIPA